MINMDFPPLIQIGWALVCVFNMVKGYVYLKIHCFLLFKNGFWRSISCWYTVPLLGDKILYFWSQVWFDLISTYNISFIFGLFFYLQVFIQVVVRHLFGNLFLSICAYNFQNSTNVFNTCWHYVLNFFVFMEHRSNIDF